MKQFRPILFMVGGLATVALLAVAYLAPHLDSNPNFVSALSAPRFKPLMMREELAKILGRQRIQRSHLLTRSLPVNYLGKNYEAKLSLDLDLQARIEKLYEHYRPLYAAFVAIDPESGRILAMVDHCEDDNKENLNLHATYPAASIFKVITSAAALEENKIQPGTVIAVNGSNSSLYKRNLRDQFNRWTRYVSVEEALAKSVNTVFAKIAVNRLGPQTLQNYADRFGFNIPLLFDMPIDMSVVQVPDDMFGLAESGSGYTKRQTLSPLQGALIASAIINHGSMPNPYLVETVEGSSGEVIYRAEPGILRSPIEPQTARKLSQMMEATIEEGTAKKEYRDYHHNPILSRLFIGAKTGSLSGENPPGKYDWFVGFAQSTDNPKRKLAFASMIVNQQFWRVKSSHIAREAILQHFGTRNSL